MTQRLWHIRFLTMATEPAKASLAYSSLMRMTGLLNLCGSLAPNDF